MKIIVYEDCNSIDNYCKHLQSLADKLIDVDAPVINKRLILCFLSEAYYGTMDIIQNHNLLPSFESFLSRLKIVELTIKDHLARENGGTECASYWFGATAMVIALSPRSFIFPPHILTTV